MKKQALSLEDVKRTIAALEVYVSALDEEIAAQGAACEPLGSLPGNLRWRADLLVR